MNYLTSSLLEISQHLGKGLLTASELCEMCLKRADYVSQLNVFITLTKELARSQALEADKRRLEGRSLGPLDGIPIAYKDNFSTKDVLTTCASKMLSNYCAPYNATVVQKLQNSGAVMMGKTNMDEFGMGSGTTDSFYGPTRNPWRSSLNYNIGTRSSNEIQRFETVPQKELENNDFFICGGSSGGSTVAVATGTSFGAIGSDTGGSTRNPAAMCGIVGLKPTYGLVSRHGLIPLCNSLDVPGILAKTVNDATILLNHVAGFDPFDSTTLKKKFDPIVLPDNVCIKNIHFGIPKEYKYLGMTDEVKDLWKSIADLVSNSGAKVSEVSLPHTQYSIACYFVLCRCDIASNFSRYDGVQFGHRAEVETSARDLFEASRIEGFGDIVKERILAGNYFLLKKNYEKFFTQATKVRRLICQDFQEVFESGVNLLLTPVTLSDAIPYSEWKKQSNKEHNAIDDYFTQPVNMAGLPAVSVPIRLSKKGLPISLQLIGREFKEESLLTAAKWIEQEVNCPVLDLDPVVEAVHKKL